MGRRRKQTYRKPRIILNKKTWECPGCGGNCLNIEIDRKQRIANASCGACKILEVFQIGNFTQYVDIYGDFVDRYYEKNPPIKSKDMKWKDLDKGFLEM